MIEAPIVHFVVPKGIDDPARVSGGNVFDRRVRGGLLELGWAVRTIPVDVDAAAPATALAGIPDRGIVLIDGLVAGACPAAIEDQSGRLRIVLLAHMVSAAFPAADPAVVEREHRALRAAHAVIATSAWTRAELVRAGVVAPERISVARPGVADISPAVGTTGGRALLCVGVVAPHKGQDLLVDALASLPKSSKDEAWSCTLAGSLEGDPGFARRIASEARRAGLGAKLRMTDVLGPDALDAAYRRADLVIAPSRVESYGIAIADALGHGIPVVASRVGGIPEAIAPSGAGILVPPGDPRALRDVIARWIADPGLRDRLTMHARYRRSGLPRWRDTAWQVATVLAGAR